MCLQKIITTKQANKLANLLQKESEKIVLKEIFKVAKEDIIVYKVLHKVNSKKFVTPYLKFRIQENTWYYQTGEKFDISILEGIYSQISYIKVEKGLHAYVNKKEAYYMCDSCEIVVQAIIPKGSLYLKGQNSDIVTDNLIFHELTPIN